MEDVTKLIALQETDAQIFRLRKTLRDKPAARQALEKQLLEAQAGVKQAEEQLKQTQLKHKEKELELQSKEEQVNKQKSRLFELKSNKEFSAMQTEIEKLKADNSLREEEVIRLLELIDQCRAGLDAAKKRYAEQEKDIRTRIAALDQECAELQANIQALTLRRQELRAAGIEPKVAELYERILANKGDLALAAVRNGACQGCALTVRPHLVSELRLGKMVSCEGCTRLLYDEEHAAGA
ncbi:MAG: hypothetical protein NC924_09460 [Candidatus Omnitrophica bacterium]|nr:hypothetical protein [Candidatus Omnitrophota bacterium]